MTSVTLDEGDFEGLDAFANTLAQKLVPGDIVFLKGDLGAGKTALIRAVCDVFTLVAGQQVTSPSFALVNTYETQRGRVHHFDLYRLTSADQLYEEIGLQEYLDGESVIFIEWPNAVDDLDLQPSLTIDVALVDKGHHFCFTRQSSN